MHTPSEPRPETDPKVNPPNTPAAETTASTPEPTPPTATPSAPADDATANAPADASANASADAKPDGRKKAKKLLLFLVIALAVLFLLNLIPFDRIAEMAIEEIPENTEPVVTYSEEFFHTPDYEEDISTDAVYQKYNREMTFTRDGESFRVTDSTANAYGAVGRLFYDYFAALMAGDTAACDTLFTDEYIEEEGRHEFAPQKVYDMTVSVVRSQTLTTGDANGDYKGYTVYYCEVAYKLRQNNGTLRRDFYEEGVTLPLIFEVLEKDNVAKINQISSIRNGIPQTSDTKGDSILMYVIWIVIMAAAIAIEAGTTAITAIWFLPAALVSLILALCNVSWQIQVLVFAILSLIFVLFGATVIRKKVLKKKYIPTNMDRIIGTEGLVTETIDNKIPSGEVKADGKRWTARSENGDVIEEGSTVTILRIEGVKLIVEMKK